MKKLFFITPLLSIVITAIGCSTSIEKTETNEGTEHTSVVEEQAKEVIEDVNVDAFAELITNGGVQILDVRTPEEWQEGTVKDANKMNFYDDGFAVQLQKLDKNQPVLVYCRSGKRSANASKQMEELGFTKIYNLLGGFNAWSEAGKEIAK